MKIRIVEPGWQGFTGQFGVCEFKDGVSVGDVSTSDASFMASLVAIENIETGKSPNPGQTILDAADMIAPVETKLQSKEESDAAAAQQGYTREQLEAVADAKGIKGIREIADKLGFKGNSITDLIEKILTAQSGATLAKHDSAVSA